MKFSVNKVNWFSGTISTFSSMKAKILGNKYCNTISDSLGEKKKRNAPTKRSEFGTFKRYKY